jgi:hypothetical protein
MAIEEDYRILGLPPGAGTDDIKRAYRKKAKATHPDTNPASETADADFVELNKAYERLVNEEKAIAEQIAPEYWFLYEMLRPETPQERALRFARQCQEEFRRNNEAFKHSMAYVPVKIFAYFLWIFGMAVALTFLFGPPVVMFHDSPTGLAMTPIMFIGAAFMFGSYQFKQQMNRYL